MREIKFRGKCIETGDWLYGALFTDKDVSYIISEMEASNDYGEGTDLYATWWAQVHPESVGQYTGLKDKNSREIYEGDIVAVNHHPFNFNGNYEVGYTEIMELSAGSLILHRVKNYCEVIGKYYENPELLEDEINIDESELPF